MTDWIRRPYDSVGVTQFPVGRHLGALQEPYLGKVVLCIDVSPSMYGQPIREANRGAEQFVREAVAARYRVGLILWDSGVVATVPLSADPQPVLRGLREDLRTSGTNVEPTVRAGITMLGHLRGDRVLAVFGDGDIGPEKPAVAAAREAAALGIRIIVRGLGAYAASSLSKIATEGAEEAEIADQAGIAGGIAAMAASIGRRAEGRR
ncbi:vWA domain-containing protein [Actinoplanes sp. NPDC049596]|uniref:vWA domain-containing protein n=1 Tax=unclassified Actinoplanes TaxID=2626549 RepID=UPI003446C378